MNSFYNRHLAALSALNYDNKTVEYFLKENMLDDKLEEIITALNEVTQLQRLLADTNCIPNSVFEETIQHLKQQQDNIVDFYEKWFTTNDFMGNYEACQTPDAIVVLGGNKITLKQRIDFAIPLLKRFPNTYAVLSGGGFSAQETESDYMLRILEESGVKNKVIQEKTSMDTLGNALFTKLLLKAKGILCSDLKILVVTSQFHAPRALHYFNTIFKSTGTFKIGTKGVCTDSERIKKLALHELLTEYQSQTSLGIFQGNDSNPIDDTAILVKLFRHHNLYKNRYDILREFLSIASKVNTTAN